MSSLLRAVRDQGFEPGRVDDVVTLENKPIATGSRGDTPTDGTAEPRDRHPTHAQITRRRTQQLGEIIGSHHITGPHREDAHQPLRLRRALHHVAPIVHLDRSEHSEPHATLPRQAHRSDRTDGERVERTSKRITVTPPIVMPW